MHRSYEIMTHPAYKDRLKRFERGLHATSSSMYEMAKNAAESYAYWNICAILAWKDYTDLLLDLRKQKIRRARKLKHAKRRKHESARVDCIVESV